MALPFHGRCEYCALSNMVKQEYEWAKARLEDTRAVLDGGRWDQSGEQPVFVLNGRQPLTDYDKSVVLATERDNLREVNRLYSISRNLPRLDADHARKVR